MVRLYLAIARWNKCPNNLFYIVAWHYVTETQKRMQHLFYIYLARFLEKEKILTQKWKERKTKRNHSLLKNKEKKEIRRILGRELT